MRKQMRVPAMAVGCAVFITSACGGGSSKSSSTSSPGAASPASSPAPPAPAPPGPRLYVSDETGGNVVVVDPVGGQVLEKIAVGKRPRGIRLSRDGKELLIALSGSPIAGPGVDESKLPPADRSADGIGVVSIKDLKLVRTITSGYDPEQVAVTPDGKRLFITNEDVSAATALDVDSGKVL